ncbi:MAG: hypothetical protein ABJB17_06825 [Burkholderiales bacterium]
MNNSIEMQGLRAAQVAHVHGQRIWNSLTDRTGTPADRDVLLHAMPRNAGVDV